MPLLKGRSLRTFKKNVEEFKTGNTFARTKAKFGTGKAIKQAYAAAHSEQRKAIAKKAAQTRRARKREKRER